MPIDGAYEPSPWEYIRDQVDLYERSNGTEGTTLEGRPCVILWSRGRKSGKVRKSPLMRVEHDGRYAVVASMGGAPQHPVWYHNITADPLVSLQDGPHLADYRAREVHGDEKAEWWARAREVWPPYDDYQANATREIPVVVLEPIDA